MENLRFCTSKIHFCSSYIVSRSSGFKYRADDWLHWSIYLDRFIQSLYANTGTELQSSNLALHNSSISILTVYSANQCCSLTLRMSLHDRIFKPKYNRIFFSNALYTTCHRKYKRLHVSAKLVHHQVVCKNNKIQ